MNLLPAEHYTDCFYILRTPEGSCVLDYSLTALCKRFQLRRYNLQLILDNQRKTHNGYSVLKFPVPTDFLQSRPGDIHKMNIQDMQIVTTVSSPPVVNREKREHREKSERKHVTIQTPKDSLVTKEPPAQDPPTTKPHTRRTRTKNVESMAHNNTGNPA